MAEQKGTRITFIVGVREELLVDVIYCVDAHSRASARDMILRDHPSLGLLIAPYNETVLNREILWCDPYRPLRDDPDPGLEGASITRPIDRTAETFMVEVREENRIECTYKVEAVTPEEASELVLRGDPRAERHAAPRMDSGFKTLTREILGFCDEGEAA